MTKRSRPKTTVVVDSSSSEDERPPKRPRVVPRAGKPSKDLRFRKTGPQTAVSIADAFNNASAQNSKANSNTARPLPSTIPLTIPSTLPSSLPSSSAAPVLPRRYKRKVQVLPGPAQVPPGPVHVLPGPVHVLPGPVQVLPGPPGLASQSSPPETPHTATTSSSTTENPLTTVYPSPLATPALPRRQSKRKVVPAPTELASSSSSPAGPNSATTATTSSSTIENQLSTILETLSSVQATQVQHAAEVASMRERLFLGGNPPESISDAFAVLDRQSTGSTVKVVADLVNSLVSTLHQPANNMNNMSNYRTYPITRSGRGRGRGGLPFGDHSYRSTPPNNVFREFQQDHHRPYRPYHGGHYNSAPAGPARHTDTQDYYPGRVWIPGPYATQQGPYAAQHRRVSVSDEQGPRYHAFAEERREPREEARRGRRFTRFSPPESPENNTLDLVPARRRGSPSQRRPALFDRMETGSEGSVTVTNAEVANSEAGSMAMIRRQASTNTRRETPKFFATLRSVSPEDEQDWEAVYAKDTQS
ncbi:hypothetical protein B0H17DRAFT_237628 [Mycena rosella]|uniref:Uncharacterized protein n=1 Tax=Mycena rosella TaxID=1033263 RepID=A0AAD7H1I4_MYCRO|nr:hypothetical protein B0H17DRAFT_237628 [Mycena rosella]